MYKNEIFNIIKVGSIYTATVIGAGFASGQEIAKFFLVYEQRGFYGIILSGLLFALIGYIVLNRVYSHRIRNYDEFLFPMTGWLMGWIVEIISILFMVSVFFIMIAGSGSLVSDTFYIKMEYGIFIMSFICMLILLADIRGVVGLGTLITPVLITGIIAIGIYIIVTRDISVFNSGNILTGLTKNWVSSAIVYVSYNSILSVVVLSGLFPYLKSRKVAGLGGIMGGAMLCVIALIIYLALYIFYPATIHSEFPIMSVLVKYNTAITKVYSLVLWLAMLLSAVTSGYCITERIGSKLKLKQKYTAVIICGVAIPFSSMGFSNLIAAIYPLFGYMGLFMVILILVNGLKDIRSGRDAS